jgi:hypothetical protein
MIDFVSFLKEKPKLQYLKSTLLLQKEKRFKTALITIQSLIKNYSAFVICIDNETEQIYLCPPLAESELENLKSSNYYILTYFKGNK